MVKDGHVTGKYDRANTSFGALKVSRFPSGWPMNFGPSLKIETPDGKEWFDISGLARKRRYYLTLGAQR